MPSIFPFSSKNMKHKGIINHIDINLNEVCLKILRPDNISKFKIYSIQNNKNATQK